jgi:hypothetical protein
MLQGRLQAGFVDIARRGATGRTSTDTATDGVKPSSKARTGSTVSRPSRGPGILRR